MAAVLVLEPIFEADLQPEQYAYRLEQSALDAVRSPGAAGSGLYRGRGCRLERYFDSIPHGRTDEVGGSADQRSACAASVQELAGGAGRGDGRRGHTQRTTRNKDEDRGTPQGGVLSPLLANLYMRRFVLGWKVLGHEQRLDAHIVNYADDFVICCRGQAAEAMAAMRDMMAKLGLTVNEKKTRLCRVPEETFSFWVTPSGGIIRCGRAGLYAVRGRPRRRSGAVDAISELTRRSWMWRDVEEWSASQPAVAWVGELLLPGPVYAAYRQVKAHTCCRLRQWLGGSTTCRGRVGHATPTATCMRSWGWCDCSARSVPPPAVGERLSPCPRAGCGKSARPVR